MKHRLILTCCIFAGLVLTAAALLPDPEPLPQDLDPVPPDAPVKLIFIHHSTGENWLADGYGNLGRELAENNYFVSDTNYGWGPNYIGDRTDIPNWMEWFRSADTPQYMDALFGESGQNASYTRGLSDPGGENSIIMFKSCFPNSELVGSPNDPAGTYEDLSVGGAKYVYNQLLQYFASRPEKLFVVITAPPLSDGTYARNARAFNLWLVNDWLDENQYKLDNVAVFDFYNVLTGKNAHHQLNNGGIEHISGNRDTLNYPTGDDHPSEKGSRKATEEFIPLLNAYYNRWIQSAPAQVPAQEKAVEPQKENAPLPSITAAQGAMVDDFEGGMPPGSGGWEAFRDEATNTAISCNAQNEIAYSGSISMALDFDVAANSWATCVLVYEEAQNWSDSEGIGFYLHSESAGTVFNLDLYAGSPDAQETYAYRIETTSDSSDGWVPIFLRWVDFHRVDWEEDAGSAFDKPDGVTGLAFGFDTFPDTGNTGRIWVDDLSLSGQPSAPPPAETIQEVEPLEETAPEESQRRLLPCGAALAVPIALIGILSNKRILKEAEPNLNRRD